jgi:hypothetical protein
MAFRRSNAMTRSTRNRFLRRAFVGPILGIDSCFRSLGGKNLTKGGNNSEHIIKAIT